MPTERPITCVAHVGAILGEGPIWVAREQSLYWVDIKGRKLFRRSTGGQVDSWDTPMRIGSFSPAAAGGFVAGSDHGVLRVDLEAGSFEPLLELESDRAGNRCNDGKVDRAGRLWLGTMDDAEKAPTGALYRIDPGLGVALADDGYAVTNGPAFNRRGDILYHNDSGRQRTYAFDLDRDGRVANRRLFAQFGEGDGFPDGMTVDADDCLWIAFWDGGCIRRFSPEGECLETVHMPVQRPTSCAFGGAGLDRLYVTSARVGLGDAELASQPLAGGLFELDVGIGGVAELPFGG